METRKRRVGFQAKRVYRLPASAQLAVSSGYIRSGYMPFPPSSLVAERRQTARDRGATPNGEVAAVFSFQDDLIQRMLTNVAQIPARIAATST